LPSIQALRGRLALSDAGGRYDLVATTSRYSLWLVPDGPAHDALQAVIDRLAREHGGPTFPPHLTVFGSFESTESDAVDGTQRLAERLAPLTLLLDDLATGETYFQSVFATIRAAPELLAAREAAQQAFPHVPRVTYRPHVSLLYGHPAPETKRAIIANLRGTLPGSFEARTLVVYETGTGMHDWRRVFAAPLAG
jgi:hypothetical protein